MANILYRFCETALESKSTKAKRTWWASFNGTLNSTWFLGLLHSNNSSSTTVCFSMLNFQLLTIKESSFPKKEMVAEVLGSFFSVCLLFTARYDTIILLSTKYSVWSVQWVHWTELVVNDICCQYEVVFENIMSYWKRQCSISLG